MCGICGRYNYKDPSRSADINEIRRMADTMIHRGPDDEGYFTSGPVGLGFRRLSIIDLAGGHQPMSDQQESVWVVFNGEIYNFPELKTELERYGHIFRTRSDTEVIIHGYKQWGTDVFNHLNGMFGIGLWDARNQRLVLARDAMGIKFVYYRLEDETLYFGSEIRPIRAAMGESPDVDPVSLNLFLRYRYTPSPYTLYKGIKKLAPGQMLILEKGSSRLERWYQYKPRHFAPPKSEGEAREELLAIYKSAMKRHLLSDVPLGLLLSGGVDSGLLLGLMNLYGNEWPTYTIGYGERFKDDELSDAKRSAKIFSARNVSIELDINTYESALSKIVSLLEEPITSSSTVLMYYVCQRAREDVKVALVGQGPDELFGGYKRHLGVHYGQYWRSLPVWVKRIMGNVVKGLPRNETLKRGIYSLDITDRMQRYEHVFSLLPGEAVDGLFHDDLINGSMEERAQECWKDLSLMMQETDELGGFQLLELRSSLPDELMLLSDKMSMAHSLEVRVPYLDREIVEYVESLPADMKVRHGIRSKWLHRQVCKQFMPAEILKRKKRGFAVNVVDEWFKHSLSKKMEGYILDNGSLMYKYLKSSEIQRLLYEHKCGYSDNHKMLYSLVVFEEWLKSL
jgi:asparagine synthase (glutamine-hydrolysing)